MTGSNGNSQQNKQQNVVLRLAGKVAHAFIDSKLTPLVIVAALPRAGFAK